MARTPRQALARPFYWKVIGYNLETGEVCLGQFGEGSNFQKDGPQRLLRVLFAEVGLTDRQRLGFYGKRTPEYVRGMDLIPWGDMDWEFYCDKPEYPLEPDDPLRDVADALRACGCKVNETIAPGVIEVDGRRMNARQANYHLDHLEIDDG